jgi:flagellar hook-associated protein 3 FlgL
MRSISYGDLAQLSQGRRLSADLRRQADRLAAEVTTGIRADKGAAVAGDHMTIAGIERALSVMQGYRTAGSEAATFTGTLQTVLTTARSAASAVATALISATTTTTATQVDALATDARQKFMQAVAALNTQIGDRYLLSGTATDARPISGGQNILDALTLAVAGQTTVTGVTSAITAWFDAAPGGGGYLDTVYGGSATALAPFRIGPDTPSGTMPTAADPAIRDMLRGLATAALVAEGALAGDVQGRALLTRAAGQTLVAAEAGMVLMQAALGTAEAHIDDVRARQSAESSGLELARLALIGADPYAAASALEDVQTRIETLYTLTARMSRMHLADFLR